MFSIACLEVSQLKELHGHQSRYGRSAEEYQSFKVVSACCAIKELDEAIRRMEAEEWHYN